MDSHEEPALSDPKKRPKPILIISIVLLTLTVCGVGAYFLWLRPLLAKPLSASLDLEAVKPAEIPTLPATSNQEGNPGDQAEQED